MSTLFNIGNKILASNTQVIDDIEYAPIDGNEFEWPLESGVFYKVVVRDYGSGNKLAWLDRNLGASQVATSSTDNNAYGDLYQWGRLSDEHEKRNSEETSTLSDSNQPGHGDFITTSSSPFDWLNPQNDNLWQGVDGINNPAPPGWRIPTEAEWQEEIDNGGITNSAGAFSSPLILPVAGFRNKDFGTLNSVGSQGFYWSSTVAGTGVRYFFFNSSNAGLNNFTRASGCSVRCVRDVT